jgi:hypothetical protein
MTQFKDQSHIQPPPGSTTRSCWHSPATRPWSSSPPPRPDSGCLILKTLKAVSTGQAR